VGSHTFPAVPLAIDGNAPHPLATSPGELMAGAVGSVFAWLLAEELMDEGHQARELVVEVGLTSETVATGRRALRAIELQARTRVSGVGEAQLQDVCERVLHRCAQAVGLREDDLALRVRSTVVGE